MSSAVTKKTAGFPGFYVFTHLGSAEDPVITNNAEGKPKENPAASWDFLVTGLEQRDILRFTALLGFPETAYSRHCHCAV